MAGLSAPVPEQRQGRTYLEGAFSKPGVPCALSLWLQVHRSVCEQEAPDAEAHALQQAGVGLFQGEKRV